MQFTYESGATGEFLFPEIIGGGVALCDLTGNGRLDLYFVQGGSVIAGEAERPPNRLYHNLGGARFIEVTDRSGAEDRRYGMGVAAGDFNNNGALDLYVTNVGRNTLLRNTGEGLFEDVTEASGTGDEGWGSSAAFVDINHSGFLDIFFANYVEWSPARERTCSGHAGRRDYCMPNAYDAPARDVLYRNNGDGTFRDISEAAGLSAAFGNGLGVVAADFNRNGLLDVFVANDQMPNQLWLNQGDETFVEAAHALGCAVDGAGKAKAGMGVAVVDLDEDGFQDIFVVNLTGETDTLYRNRGRYFADETFRTGLSSVSRRFTRFGTGFSDFDNDGVLDLYQANGRVSQSGVQHSGDPYAESNLLFRGVAARFEEFSPEGGTAEPLIATSRAAAFGDIDNDGGIDILVVNRDGPVHLLRNVAPGRGNWIMLRVLDENGRDAFDVTVTLTVNERTISRNVRSAYSYLAANDPRVHVGLGKVERVTDVRVRWLDGEETNFGAFDANQIVTLSRTAGTE